MDASENKWKIPLLVIIFGLGIIIFLEMTPYLSGFLGAFTIYIMVRNQMRKLTDNKKMKKSIAATLILIEVILLFIIPISAVVWLLVSKIKNINLDTHELILQGHQIIGTIQEKTGYDLLSSDNLSSATAEVSKLLQMALDGITSFSINAVIMVFVLYFLLIGGSQLEKYIFDILPFKKGNKKNILRETKVMITANAIGIPLLASVQGMVAYAGYVIFGASSPILLAVLTCFSTILPLVGTTIVWLPAALYLGISGNWPSAIGLSLYGMIVISGSDNVVRFLLQKKIADTNPLITIFGVIIGLSLFGFWGVIFGPLLLSTFLLCIDIYKEEYIDKTEV
ncbi:AI-2E family transporter [Dysgonomonas sp. 520]|uniref:AI-2E family transporter n=1 Tax=Dysgonomonas sp. 520 TaxID=2302931 RepID=UPI0013D8950E|nr:AI-2E family transporter [Dysgonomonas sp. 520]NDW11112.1 AI-2E family transporter [Dysgonomonas sp. 520]